MDDLARLAALAAIRDLPLRDAFAADGKDLDAVAGLFAPDVDNDPFGPGRHCITRDTVPTCPTSRSAI